MKINWFNSKNIFSLITSVKINWFKSEKYFFNRWFSKKSHHWFNQWKFDWFIFREWSMRNLIWFKGRFHMDTRLCPFASFFFRCGVKVWYWWQVPRQVMVGIAGAASYIHIRIIHVQFHMNFFRSRLLSHNQ